VFGALTANTPGAPIACQGFPLCRVIAEHGTPLWIQVTHRVIAFLLLFHLIGIIFGVRKRAERGPVRAAAWTALSLIVLQVLVAAAMVEMHLPSSLRSLHQPISEVIRESPSRGEFATPEGVST
jgi:heme a synthase